MLLYNCCSCCDCRCRNGLFRTLLSFRCVSITRCAVFTTASAPLVSCSERAAHNTNRIDAARRPRSVAFEQQLSQPLVAIQQQQPQQPEQQQQPQQQPERQQQRWLPAKVRISMSCSVLLRLYHPCSRATSAVREGLLRNAPSPWPTHQTAGTCTSASQAVNPYSCSLPGQSLSQNCTSLQMIAASDIPPRLAHDRSRQRGHLSGGRSTGKSNGSGRSRYDSRSPVRARGSDRKSDRGSDRRADRRNRTPPPRPVR